jgi:uncharacterized RDD family membrane protein YckC
MRIETAQNVGIDVEVAGLGDRALAALIDYLVLLCAYLALTILFAWIESRAFYVLTVLPLFLYFPLCEVLLDGQSVGKKLRGIKVARVDGSQPTLGSYALRWLLRLVEVEATFGSLAFVTVLLNGRGQRLGDLAAGTAVVKVPARLGLDDTIYTRVEDTHTLTFPEVERLTDADVETAKEVLHAILEEGKTYTAFAMGNRIKAVLEARMGVRSDLHPPRFLRTVIQDYNHLHGRV